MSISEKLKLNFKLGNKENLNQTNIDAGNIYVTKDTHEMYIDVDNVNRIQIVNKNSPIFSVDKIITLDILEESEENKNGE